MSEFDKNEWKKLKAEEKKKVYEMADKATKRLVTEQGWFAKYLDTQSRMDRYSAVNCLLIMVQKPEARKLKEFNDWSEDGLTIKAGEKGICILEPSEYVKKDGTTAISYNVRKVFDISQTNSTEIAQLPPSRNPDRMMKTLKKLYGIDWRNTTFQKMSYEVATAEIQKASTYDVEFKAQCISYMLCRKYGLEYEGDVPSIASRNTETENTKNLRAMLSQIRNVYSAIHNSVYEELTRERTEEFRR